MNDSADLLAGLDPDRLLALSLRQVGCGHRTGVVLAKLLPPSDATGALGSPGAHCASRDRALSTVLAALVDDDSAWTAEVPVRHVAAIASAVVCVLDRAGLLV